jgi:predicted AAA+ superfamily ATPase
MRAAGIKMAADVLEKQALEWALTRGARSGRVAFQFCQDAIGKQYLAKAMG